VLVGAESAGGTATVQLSSGFLEIPPGDQVLALGQVVLTLTDLRGVGRVRFEINGEAVATPLPDGTSTAAPVARDDFSEVVGG
jgi:spore germination protein GerM